MTLGWLLQANKEFTAEKDCLPIVCPKVPEVASSKRTKSSATYGDRARSNCDKGHTTDGTGDGDKGFTLECFINEQFGEPQKCVPVSCGTPEDMPC